MNLQLSVLHPALSDIPGFFEDRLPLPSATSNGLSVDRAPALSSVSSREETQAIASLDSVYPITRSAFGMPAVYLGLQFATC